MRILRNTVGTLLVVACLVQNEATIHAQIQCWDECVGVSTVRTCTVAPPYVHWTQWCHPDNYVWGTNGYCPTFAQDTCDGFAYPFSGSVTYIHSAWYSEMDGTVWGELQCAWYDYVNGC